MKFRKLERKDLILYVLVLLAGVVCLIYLITNHGSVYSIGFALIALAGGINSLIEKNKTVNGIIIAVLISLVLILSWLEW